MIRYEILLLAVPEITNDEVNKLETQFNKMVKDIKGNIISFEKWGKYPLAYPVRNNDYGVYFLTRFELPSDKKNQFFEDIKDLFAIKYHDIIMRHIVSVLPSNKSLEYQRPKSLEESPKDKEVESFFKKSKDSSDHKIITKEEGESEEADLA